MSDEEKCKKIQRPIMRVGRYITGILGLSSVVSFFLTFTKSYPALLNYTMGRQSFWDLPNEPKAFLAFLVLTAVGLGFVALAVYLGHRWSCYRF